MVRGLGGCVVQEPQGQKLLSYDSDKSEWTLILSAFLSFVIEQQSSSGITIVALEARLRTLKMVFLHGAKVQKELSSSFAGSSRAEVEEDADIFEAFFNECEDQQDGVQPSVEAPRPKADEGLPAESKGGADLGAVGGASHIEPGTSPGGLGLSSEHTKDGSDLQESPMSKLEKIKLDMLSIDGKFPGSTQTNTSLRRIRGTINAYVASMSKCGWWSTFKPGTVRALERRLNMHETAVKAGLAVDTMTAFEQLQRQSSLPVGSR